MADETERLVVELESRVSSFEKGLAKAVANLDQFASSADRSEKAAAKFGGNVSKSFAPIDKASAASAFQLRQLSFQLNDVITSLASGQSPFMILAQQGGQVYQALQMGPGGVGGSLKALSGQIAAMVTPTRLAVAGLAGVGVATVAAVASWKSYALALDDLAKSAGTTSTEMSKLQAAASFKGIGQTDFAAGMEKFSAAVYDAFGGRRSSEALACEQPICRRLCHHIRSRGGPDQECRDRPTADPIASTGRPSRYHELGAPLVGWRGSSSQGEGSRNRVRCKRQHDSTGPRVRRGLEQGDDKRDLAFPLLGRRSH